MKLSKFAQRFSEHSGIVLLMDDLGDAMAGEKDVFMLGGGNPAHIPEVQSFFQDRMQRLLDEPAEFAHVVGDYDSPQGDKVFLTALADLLNHEYGWGVSLNNIALTAGSQSAFFLLFNMYAGEYEDDSRKKILLPLAPEYIGYGDVGLAPDMFTAYRPTIEKFNDHTFKYHVDFEKLTVDKSTGAICVSRPTNPTGNVLTDDEVSRLVTLASDHDVPLILDNAYGMPFPGIIFSEAELVWNENIILSMSLSKLGLPGARTGIIVAHEEVIKTISNINGIVNLALGSIGPALALDLIKSGEVTRISQAIIKPYYENKAKRAMTLLHEQLSGIDYYIHKTEGAIFLWLWFPGLSVTCEELYHRLKQRGVLVIPGHYFFAGLEDDDWRHKHECIRMTYSMNDDIVSAGIKIIADEVKKLQGFENRLKA